MGHDAKFKGKKKCPADRLQYVIKKALIPPCRPSREHYQTGRVEASAGVRARTPSEIATACIDANVVRRNPVVLHERRLWCTMSYMVRVRLSIWKS